jgi:hypothetical protein
MKTTGMMTISMMRIDQRITTRKPLVSLWVLFALVRSKTPLARVAMCSDASSGHSIVTV